MDMQKIGNFLKALRKEKNLTQEQLAEIMGVAGRTVSRWETASNMPDISILIQLAEYYDVEVKEILEGERRGDTMEKELKETLQIVADYSEEEKRRAAVIGNTAFGVTFITCAVAIVVQLLWLCNMRMVIGETISLVSGGIIYLILMANGGVWEASSGKKRSPLNDCVLSVVIAAVFSALYGLTIYRISPDGSKVAMFAALFFIGITALNFIVLRVLAAWSKMKKEKKNGQNI